MFNTLTLILTLFASIVVLQVSRPINPLYLLTLCLPVVTLVQVKKRAESKIFFFINVAIVILTTLILSLITVTFGRLNLIPFL